MANLTADQERRLQEAFKDFDSAQPRTAPTAKALSVDFCKDWPTAKGILEFLANLPVIPSVVRDAIRVVIKAGDLAHSAIC